MFDTHAHLDFDAYDADRDTVIRRARSAGIEGILTIGIDLPSSIAAAGIAAEHDGIAAAAAVHPNSTADAGAEDGFTEIRRMVLNGEFAAVGETGMDLYRDRAPREVQESFFRRHIKLALESGKPLVIHCREAHEEVEAVLRDYELGDARFVMHCFGAPSDYAQVFGDMGLYISFAGNVTYKNAHDLRLAAKSVAADRILSETDCPFLAPVPLRGKRNEPALMAHTVQVLAEVRGVDRDTMDAQLTRNAKRFIFG